MFGLAVAYFVPHAEGVETGILTKPGDTSGLLLTDLYEVDAEIMAFATYEEAHAWLEGKLDEETIDVEAWEDD